jgi:hypothetical protein
VSAASALNCAETALASGRGPLGFTHCRKTSARLVSSYRSSPISFESSLAYSYTTSTNVAASFRLTQVDDDDNYT